MERRERDLKTSMKWEIIEEENTDNCLSNIRRTKVPGGWLVESYCDRLYKSNQDAGYGCGVGVTFVPDPNEEWKPKIIRTYGPIF